MTLSEKVLYLAGIREGVNLKASAPDLKFLNAVIDFLNDPNVTTEDMKKWLSEVDNEAPVQKDPAAAAGQTNVTKTVEQMYEDIVAESMAEMADEAPVEETIAELPVEEEVPVEEPILPVLEDALEEVEEAPAEAPVEEIAEPEEAEDEEDLYEVECPNCGTVMYVAASVLAEGSVTCPGCQKTLTFEIENED